MFLCLYELYWKNVRQRCQRGSDVVVIFRTSFSSDAHGELICWFLTSMRTLLHLCVVVLDYDRTNCYISYLSMFVFLLCIYKRHCCAIELSGTRYAVFLFIRMCSDILFIEIVCATRYEMIVQVPRIGTIIQE